MKRYLLLVFFPILCTGPLFSTDLPKRIYTATRMTASVPKIDGRLDDACWLEGTWAGDFTQQMPNQGGKPTEPSEFKILYDDGHLYVAFRAHAFRPELMDRRVSRRDDFQGDVMGVCFDSYYDHRTGYEFNLTSAGGKIDLVQLDTGGEWFVDYNWDAVWDGKTAVGDSGWTAELRIPFSQLRFAKKEEQVWGIHVWRWLNAFGEEDQFQLIPLDSQGRVHRFGILQGIRGVPSPRRIEILPYVRGSLNRFQSEADNSFRDSGSRWGGGMGVDGRVGLSGNFNLDFTVNPDFGQVEADPSVVNLSAFETFYDEKRPFFMEGRQLMDFELDGQPLFYSRRIGHAPSRYPSLSQGESADVPDNTTILGAAKITGKTSGGWSIGILETVTGKENAKIQSAANERRETVEPLTNFMAARLQRDFSAGNHSLGMMATAVHRDLGETALKFLPDAAYTGGVDGTMQWGNRTYFLNAKAVFSHVSGDPNALIRLQRSSVHNFQRPDADNLSVDSTQTSMSGTGGSVAIGKGGNGRWRFEEEVNWRSPGLELNDIGYLQQTDQISQESDIDYVVNEPKGVVNKFSLSFDQSHFWNYGGDRLGLDLGLSGNVEFRNFWSIYGSLEQTTGRLDTRLLRGGSAIRLPDARDYYISFQTDYRKRVQFSLGYSRNDYEDDSDYWAIYPSLYLRATDNLDCSFSPNYSVNRNNWQYVTTLGASDGNPRYILGRIDQRTFGMTIRLNYYVTPDFSIQYYGQPFVSAGQYSDLKRVSDPRAEGMADRCEALDPADSVPNPDFNFREFRSNLVLRWEYKTGSTLYLVWTHGRSQYIQNGGFDFSRDLEELFDIYPNNVFLVKVNHWFAL